MPEDKTVVHTRLLVNEVARRTHHRHGLTRYLVRVVLNELVAVIAEQLAEGNTVTIAGFGRFDAVEHKGRRVEGRDGKEYRVPSRLVPRFRPYPFLRLKLQGRAPEPPPRDPKWPPWWP
jgi:nucleoid DNA-binding protein